MSKQISPSGAAAQKPAGRACIYLIRHATPDWNRTDLRYDIPPGPPLVAQGEAEARQLGEFLKGRRLRKLFHSPLERAKRTAQISAGIAGLALVELESLAEWRRDEDAQQLADRLQPCWQQAVQESQQVGALGLVTHGGPVGVLLKYLGLTEAQISSYRERFDHHNPLPPAGVWLAQKESGQSAWQLELVFTPELVGSDEQAA